MTSKTATQFIALRKEQLQKLISEAISLNLDSNLFDLKAKWVHRYGLETLPDSQEEKILVKDYPEFSCTTTEKNTSEINQLSADQSFDYSLNTNNLEKESCNIFNKDQALESIQASLNSIETDDSDRAQDNKDSLESAEESMDKPLKELSKRNAPTPPQPEISYLRRWLVSSEEDITKAS